MVEHRRILGHASWIIIARITPHNSWSCFSLMYEVVDLCQVMAEMRGPLSVPNSALVSTRAVTCNFIGASKQPRKLPLFRLMHMHSMRIIAASTSEDPVFAAGSYQKRSLSNSYLLNLQEKLHVRIRGSLGDEICWLRGLGVSEQTYLSKTKAPKEKVCAQQTRKGEKTF